MINLTLDVGCVHLLVHYVGEVIFQLKDVDRDRYSCFDLVADIFFPFHYFVIRVVIQEF